MNKLFSVLLFVALGSTAFAVEAADVGIPALTLTTGGRRRNKL